MNSYQQGVIASTMTPLVIESGTNASGVPDMSGTATQAARPHGCEMGRSGAFSGSMALLFFLLALALWRLLRQ